MSRTTLAKSEAHGERGSEKKKREGDTRIRTYVHSAPSKIVANLRAKADRDRDHIEAITTYVSLSPISLIHFTRARLAYAATKFQRSERTAAR